MFLLILLVSIASNCGGMESDSVQEEMAQLRAQMKILTKTVEDSKKREDELIKKLEGLTLKVNGLTIKEEETAKAMHDLTLKEEETAKKLYGLTIKEEDSSKRIDGLAADVRDNHAKEEEIALKLNTLSIKDEEMTKKFGSLVTEIKQHQEKDKETARRVGVLAEEVKENHKKVEDAAKKDEKTAEKVEGLTKEVEENHKKEVETATKVEGLSTNINEYCSMLAKDICGPCQCKDDRRLKNQYFCNCQNLPIKRDCLQYHAEGFKTDGIYIIHQNNIKVIQVYCDQTTDGGGWIVFQRRLDGSVKFYRNWASYKRGFGDVEHEFWLGNDNLFTISVQGMVSAGNELRVDLEDWEGDRRYAKYKNFQVLNEKRSYQMYVSDYSGNAGDGGNGMTYHNGMKFSTFDRDHNNCAQTYLGGWWYDGCQLVNLNGKYYDYPKWGTSGVEWHIFRARPYSLKFTEMKIRRKLKE